MDVETDETLPVRSAEDVVRVRQQVRTRAVGIGLSLIDQTKVVTAASELARNTLEHGGGGVMRLQVVRRGARRGVRLTFTDKGKGIPDTELALRDHYSTGSGLGLGLGGAKRLCNEFEIASTPGEGTTVTVVRWR